MRLSGRLRLVNRRWPSRIPQTAMALADQGIISAGTFAFNVLLARTITVTDYGHFAVIIGFLSLMQTVCASIVFYPLTVRGAAADEAHRGRLIVSALIMTPVVCLPLAVVLGALIGWAVDGRLLLPCFALLVSNQIQESMRRGLLTDFRHGAAIGGDALSYVGQVALLVLALRNGGATLVEALWMMVSTSILAAVIQMLQVAPRGVPLPFNALITDFWSLGYWSLTSNVLNIARTQSLPWLLTRMSGPAAAGMFQIAFNLINVVNPVVSGVCNIVPQSASRALRDGDRAAWDASWPSIGAGMVLVGGCVSLLALAPGVVLWLLYGSRADPSILASPIRILAAGAMLYYVASTACAYLFGVHGGRDALVADGASTLAMAVMGPSFVALFGLDGACAAFTLSLFVRSAALGFFIAARIHHRGVGRAGRGLSRDRQNETPA